LRHVFLEGAGSALVEGREVGAVRKILISLNGFFNLPDGCLGSPVGVS
jgi:hypothetical protein